MSGQNKVTIFFTLYYVNEFDSDTTHFLYLEKEIPIFLSIFINREKPRCVDHVSLNGCG